jgi:hypothetical protein
MTISVTSCGMTISTGDHPYYKIFAARRYSVILGVFAPGEQLRSRQILERVGNEMSIFAMRRAIASLIKEGKLRRVKVWTGVSNVWHYEVVDAK